MKIFVRICMAFIIALMLATVCAAQCGPARGNTGGGSSVDAMIIAHEKQIIEAIKKKDAAAFKNLVDVNGTVVGMGGIGKISAIINDLFSADLTFSRYDMESPQVTVVDKDAAILSYKSNSTTTFQGETTSRSAYETSVLVKRGNKWIVIFHQSSDLPSESGGATAGGSATTPEK
jgi:uncharacterized protein (TIGR02246 family)